MEGIDHDVVRDTREPGVIEGNQIVIPGRNDAGWRKWTCGEAADEAAFVVG
jgi:hypothetical protein